VRTPFGWKKKAEEVLFSSTLPKLNWKNVLSVAEGGRGVITSKRRRGMAS